MNARKRCHRHGVAGKGEWDDTAKRANAVRPYGSRFTFLPVGEAISLPQALPSGAMQRNGMLGCWAVAVSDCEIVIDLFGYVKERWNG